MHSKYATSGWYPAFTSVSNPALISSLTPPHSTACSPNKSVSVSSVNVVSSTPARVQPSPFAYDSASAFALPLASCSIAISAGVPPPSVKTSRTRWPGAFGAIMETSTSFGGLMVPKRMLKPCANISVLPLRRCGDLFAIELGLLGVRRENHDDVGPFGGLRGRLDG